MTPHKRVEVIVTITFRNSSDEKIDCCSDWSMLAYVLQIDLKVVFQWVTCFSKFEYVFCDSLALVHPGNHIPNLCLT